MASGGCEVRFGESVVGAHQNGGGVSALIRFEGMQERTERGRYLIGADGAASLVRISQGIEFQGLTLPEFFLVLTTPFDFREEIEDLSFVNYVSDPEEWLVLLRTRYFWRVLFPTGPEHDDGDLTGDASVQRRMQSVLPRSEPYEVTHRSLYRVHQRVAERYRLGRILLVGDAAHVNNPLGGMGMNGSVHDAVNLAKKLIEIWRGADGSLLDRYERQRRHGLHRARAGGDGPEPGADARDRSPPQAGATRRMEAHRGGSGGGARVPARLLDDRLPRARAGDRVKGTDGRPPATDADLALYRRQGLGGPVGFGDRPALLVVDFTNAFADPARFGGGNIAEAIANTRPVLEAARRAGLPVAFTRVVYASDGSDAGVFTQKAPGLLDLTEEAEGSQIVAELTPEPGEHVIRKTQPSAFFGTDLAPWLLGRGADTLVVTGATTSGCVRASVVDAMSYNLRAVVVRDCVGDRALGPRHTRQTCSTWSRSTPTSWWRRRPWPPCLPGAAPAKPREAPGPPRRLLGGSERRDDDRSRCRDDGRAA